MKRSPYLATLVSLASLTALALAVAGCGTRGEPRDLMMEEARSRPIERPIAMQGEGTFLEGTLVAVATISRGFDRVGTPDGDGKRRRRDDEFDMYGRKRDSDSGFSQVYHVGGEYSEEDQKEMIENYIRQAQARRAAGSPMPPVTLKVHFQNRGTAPMELEVTEVNSALGNFAVRPPTLTIAAGETGTLNPMISQLGVMSDEIALKLAVRVAGKKEEKIVTITNIIANSLRKQFETPER